MDLITFVMIFKEIFRQIGYCLTLFNPAVYSGLNYLEKDLRHLES